MNILYFGDDDKASTSFHRAKALERLNHSVDIFNIKNNISKWHNNKYLSAFHYRTGYVFLQNEVCKKIQKITNLTNYDMVWVDSGELFNIRCINFIKKHNIPIVLYNVDDPTGKRDGMRFYSLRKCLIYFDLVVVVRKETEIECLQLGCKKVLRVWRSYDEIMHKPIENISDISDKFKSEVAFIGAWMQNEKRDEFLLALAEKGIPISIWGGRWEKSIYWRQLKQYYRGDSLSGLEYVSAIQGSKICLGFLSKGNRDLHTQRSLEIPFIGGLFCAERTNEHLDLYKDGVEAIFWDDVDECFQLCKKLLNNYELREKIRIEGMKKVRSMQVGNEDICRKIIYSLTLK